MLLQDAGSFRDISGHVFTDGTTVLRTVNACYQEQWEALEASGFLQRMEKEGLLVRHTERPPLPGSWKTLEVERIPFISYPYEWSFSQLKQAALLTLQLQKRALEEGFILKDATAYNVQFVGSRPVFIDLLSFEKHDGKSAWQAYGQFCRHFVAPLALIAKTDWRCGLLSRQWIDGVPLELACRLLPWHARLSPGLYLHLYLHAGMQKKYEDGRKAAAKVRSATMGRRQLLDLADSLERCVAGLSAPEQNTEWGEYYTDTNYTPAGAEEKSRIVERVAAEHGGELAVDLGANTGVFSRMLCGHFKTVLAPDMDPRAVEKHAVSLAASGNAAILPLVLDLSSPSPDSGWACRERRSFMARCDADMVTALALCHHLVMGAGIPLPHVASFMASLVRPGGIVLFEFVPREDSQVQRLLAARDDIFASYTLERCLESFAEAGMREEASFSIRDSVRTLHCFRKESR